MSKVEILAPAGSLEGLYASLQMGADAVYVGTNRFGARAFADNPTVEQLQQALTYAHLRNKKIYLTVNTLLTEEELEKQLYPMIAPLYENGLDACIVQDFGVMSFLHDNFPAMDLHASTQMTLFGGDEAELYRPFGVTRYVPARELSIKEIKKAREQTDLEIEVFVHGALCYCYSGQCLMSEVIGNRSGNRGMCAQPCRLSFLSPYGEQHWFSTKDSCTLFHIPDMVDAGIDSFKIEGRMKRKEYSAYLSYLYRHYVDFYQTEGREAFTAIVENPDSILWKDYKKCQELYNRGGFSRSFLFEKDKKNVMYPQKNGHYGLCVGEVVAVKKGKAKVYLQEDISYQDILEFRGEDGMAAYEYTVKDAASKEMTIEPNVLPGSRIYKGQRLFRTRNATLLQEIDDKLAQINDSIPLTGICKGRIGEPLLLSVEGCGVTVKVEGTIVMAATKRPVAKEEVEKRLQRMGATKYVWQTLSTDWEEGAFIPLGEINKLRRDAIAAWEKEATLHRERSGLRLVKKQKKKTITDCRAIISVATVQQLQTALETSDKKTRIHLKLEDFSVDSWEYLFSLLKNREVILSFPRILRGKGLEQWENNWQKYKSQWKQIKVGGIVINSHRAFLLAKEKYTEARRIADENWYHINTRAEEVCASMGIDTTVSQVYGRIPVMVTEGCLKKTAGQCDGKCERIEVCSPKKDKFVVVNHCDCCYNTIYTKMPVRKSAQGRVERLNFTWETVKEMRKVLKEWNLL